MTNLNFTKEIHLMPIYFLFIIAAIIFAIFSNKIDEKVNANGKLKKVVITFCIGIVLVLSIAFKIAL